MIDVNEVVFNALWILGLALVFATWSYARFAAYRDHVKTRLKLDTLPYALVLDLGLLLFIGGMTGTETRLWGRLLWMLLGMVVIVEATLRIRTTRAKSSEE